MPVLIVECDAERSRLWQQAISSLGLNVTVVGTQEDAIRMLQTHDYKLMVMNLDLQGASALAIADYASYRHPELRIIFLSASGVFSDGSIFQHAANACAYLPASTPPSDLAAMVEHYRSAA
ncbi:response regulator [Acidimangrovimonas sediminis]|uniref:response regulator n=1 Tax=Acidimangrovimonas sediminis TaxID=2056283 RepID=UPI000C803D19|nr:response regulator [Acidimangrovimonas sediminis]